MLEERVYGWLGGLLLDIYRLLLADEMVVGYIMTGEG